MPSHPTFIRSNKSLIILNPIGTLRLKYSIYQLSANDISDLIH